VCCLHVPRGDTLPPPGVLGDGAAAAGVPCGQRPLPLHRRCKHRRCGKRQGCTLAPAHGLRSCARARRRWLQLRYAPPTGCAFEAQDAAAQRKRRHRCDVPLRPPAHAGAARASSPRIRGSEPRATRASPRAACGLGCSASAALCVDVRSCAAELSLRLRRALLATSTGDWPS